MERLPRKPLRQRRTTGRRTAAAPWRVGPALLVVAAGCVDALGPESGVEGLAGLPIELPTAGNLSGIPGAGAVDPDLAERWRASWARPPAEGDQVRAEVRNRLADQLAEEDPATERLKATRLLNGLQGLLGPEAPATHALAPALEALRVSEGEKGREAWEALLAASDLALSIDPEVLAEGLLVCAGRAERRKDEPDPYRQQMAIRARHLQVGARRALQGNDPMLAVRRAFYGCRLLAENEVDAEGRE